VAGMALIRGLGEWDAARCSMLPFEYLDRQARSRMSRHHKL
jgi:hypothetical protein